MEARDCLESGKTLKIKKNTEVDHVIYETYMHSLQLVDNRVLLFKLLNDRNTLHVEDLENTKMFIKKNYESIASLYLKSQKQLPQDLVNTIYSIQKDDVLFRRERKYVIFNNRISLYKSTVSVDELEKSSQRKTLRSKCFCPSDPLPEPEVEFHMNPGFFKKNSLCHENDDMQSRLD